MPEKTLPEPWTFWLDRSSKGVSKIDYMTGLQHKGSAVSTEDFWGKWEEVKKELNTPSSETTNIRIFKQDITPIWEDPMNTHGGKFVAQFRTLHAAAKTYVALLTSLLMGELGSLLDNICGIVLSVREWGSTISIWSKRDNQKGIATLSNALQRLMSCGLEYRLHRSYKPLKHRPAASYGGESADYYEPVEEELPVDFLSALSSVKLDLETRMKKHHLSSLMDVLLIRKSRNCLYLLTMRLLILKFFAQRLVSVVQN